MYDCLANSKLYLLVGSVDQCWGVTLEKKHLSKLAQAWPHT